MDKILNILKENSNLSYGEIAAMINEPEDYGSPRIYADNPV